MSNQGFFSGDPHTEWLVNDSGPDREMQLLENFSFTDPNNRVWPAPKTSVIDGASIPTALWSLVGSPYTDDYRRASVVHDVACKTLGVPRKDADIMFFHACRAGGCGFFQACVLYAGVRIGAWVGLNMMMAKLPPAPLLFREHMNALTSDEQYLQKKLLAISQDMKPLTEDASFEEIDSIIDQHLKI